MTVKFENCQDRKFQDFCRNFGNDFCRLTFTTKEFERPFL